MIDHITVNEYSHRLKKRNTDEYFRHLPIDRIKGIEEKNKFPCEE